MRLYKVEVGRNWEWATFTTLRGSYTESGSRCEVCGRLPLKRTHPGVFELDDDRPIADFTSAGGAILATRDTAQELAQTLMGLLPRPTVLQGRFRGRRSYDGPELLELVFEKTISWNPKVSTLEVHFCEGCQRPDKVKVLNVETREHEEEVGPNRYRIVPHAARTPGKGILLNQSELEDNDFFFYGDRFFMCTEKARRFIVSRQWTNIEFLEYGESLPA